MVRWWPTTSPVASCPTFPCSPPTASPRLLDKRHALAEANRVLKKGGWLVICHTASRQTINELHRSVGGVVAHDTIPGEKMMQQLLREAGLEKVRVQDEPDRYVALAQREGWYSAPSERNR